MLINYLSRDRYVGVKVVLSSLTAEDLLARAVAVYMLYGTYILVHCRHYQPSQPSITSIATVITTDGIIGISAIMHILALYEQSLLDSSLTYDKLSAHQVN